MANTLMKTKLAVTHFRINSFRFFIAIGLAVVGMWPGASTNVLASITFSGSNTNIQGEDLSASATFTASGSQLTVTLLNTFPGDTPDQSSVLTAIFFSGANGLTPVSATAGTGSVEWIGTTSSAPQGPSVLGAEWEYASGGGGNPGGATAGIASAGLDNNFGMGNFAGTNSDMLDGSSYGILSAGYAGSDMDGLDDRQYIQNTMVFVLSNFTGSVSSISDVSFQYGTSDSEPNLPGVVVPEPSSITLAAIGILFLALLQRKRR
jgi:hypothetical protein